MRYQSGEKDLVSYCNPCNLCGEYCRCGDDLLYLGWKVVMHNINDNAAVKLEFYLDDKNDNEWTKVTDLVDEGGWFANSSDEEFDSADCGRPKDYIITNGGPILHLDQII
jgi:hypothetical protein